MPNVPLPKGIDEVAVPPKPATVVGVLERLKAIQGTFREEPLANAPEPADLETALSDLKKDGRDGVVCFNHLYRVITAEINREIMRGRFFHDNNFLTQFDVIFADRYLDAIRRYTDPAKYGPAPECWRILFEYRKDREISPMQFAICGVTCHVFFDLPIAVVQVCKEMGESLDDGTLCDFLKINDIFHKKIPKLREHFEDEFERRFDRSIVKLFANHVCDFIVVQSRDLAWQHAKELWGVWAPPGNDKLTKKKTDLDNCASYIVRGILWTPRAATETILNTPLLLLRAGLVTLAGRLKVLTRSIGSGTPEFLALASVSRLLPPNMRYLPRITARTARRMMGHRTANPPPRAGQAARQLCLY
jgi:Family of unknown function (DUF5995)